MAATTFTPDLAVEVLVRLARGRTLHSVCRDPDMPLVKTVHAWARKDAVFADQLEAARALGPRGRSAGGWRPGQYTDALARGICAALEDGFTLTEICASDAVPVTLFAVLGWTRRRPDFRAAYAHATRPRPSPRGLVIGGGRRGGYTPERAQAVLDRLLEGRALADVCRDPDMPSIATLRQWRRRHIDFHLAWQRTRRLQMDLMMDTVLEAAEHGRGAPKAHAVLRGLSGQGVEPSWVGLAGAQGLAAGRRAGWAGGWEGASGWAGPDEGEAAAGMGHNSRGRTL